MNVSGVVRRILNSSRGAQRASALTLTVALGCSAGGAWAQGAGAGNRSQEPVLLEEVVVTAQFREEGLQKTRALSHRAWTARISRISSLRWTTTRTVVCRATRS